MNEELQQECAQAIGLLSQGKVMESIQAFTALLQKNDQIGLAWNNRGLGLLNMGHPFDAVLNIDRAIALEPDTPEYHNNRGAALYDQEDADKALDAFKKALELRPVFPEALSNQGNVLKWKGKVLEAIESYRGAVAARPDYADAHLHLAFALLTAGLYEEGWKEFDWRWKVGQMPERGLPIPAWEGESLEGKTLLFYGEQGFGDVLNFIRYASVIKEKFGGRVLVEVRLPLARLAATTPGVDGVVVFGEDMPKDIDYALPMLSAPRICGTTVETIPWNGPYFKTHKYRVQLWRERLTRLPPGLLVGVCWAGMSRASQPAAESVDRRRSTTLNSFAPLAQVPGVSWVSLQKGPPSEQVKAPPMNMTIGDWTDECDDFADTAALIECLDLVITVDTAVVHLAAALGKPTWLLSRWDGCWRWLGNRSDSPWYPSLRQFVQPGPNQWEPLMQHVAEHFREFVNLRKAA